MQPYAESCNQTLPKNGLNTTLFNTSVHNMIVNLLTVTYVYLLVIQSTFCLFYVHSGKFSTNMYELAVHQHVFV